MRMGNKSGKQWVPQREGWFASVSSKLAATVAIWTHQRKGVVQAMPKRNRTLEVAGR